MQKSKQVHVPPILGLHVLRKALGLSAALFVFYLAGHYLWAFPFPTVSDLLTILMVATLGVGLGLTFARVWPLAPKPGLERVARTLLLTIPALGLGFGLQLTLQGAEPKQALYLIFALAAWLGSGLIVRLEEVPVRGKQAKT
ncbi:MAG: hypothetical protein M3498_10090 [Deinococcota bacterium]|jgi:hypothetical protein|nr:hypothetical protein [Deinococcota bacterium]